MNPSFQSRVYLGMTTLKELIVKRPSRQFQYLHVLLDLSSHEKEKVRLFPDSYDWPTGLNFSRLFFFFSAEFNYSCSGTVFLFPGQDDCPGFSEENVREGSSQGLH